MVRAKLHIEQIQRDSDIITGRDDVICLDRNERVSAFTDDQLRNMLSGLSSASFNMYPNLGPLYERLQSQTGVDASQIAIGGGSDAIIRRIFQAFVAPGDVVVAPDPSYGMYRVWSRVYEAEFKTVPYSKGPNFAFDLETLIAEIESGARVCFIANPDQPTGATLEISVLRRIAEICERSDTLFVIDEAYYPFHAETALPLLEDFKNTLVVRTFSKVGGIAGLRVGYGLGAPNVINALQAVRSPGEVNSAGATIATYLLDHRDIMEDFRSEVEEGRHLLIAAAESMGFIAPSCAGNFQLLYCPTGVEPSVLIAGLKERGYLIKGGFKHPGLENYVRVTLDGPAIMTLFLEKLGDVMACLCKKNVSNEETVRGY